MTPARTLLLVGPAVALAGLMLVVTFAPRAKAAVEMLYEPEDTRTHIVVVCPPGEPCHPRGKAISKTACHMDITGVAITAEKGTRLQCVRVKR